MGRNAGRRPADDPPFVWHAQRASHGRYVIVNEQGEEPLKSPDPVEQAEAAYLAAAAPGLRKALEVATRRLLDIEPPYTRDAQRIREAQIWIHEARVPFEELRRIASGRTQLELQLDR